MMKLVDDPKPGDIVIFSMSDSGGSYLVLEHLGLLVSCKQTATLSRLVGRGAWEVMMLCDSGKESWGIRNDQQGWLGRVR